MTGLEDIATLPGFGESKVDNFRAAGYESLEDLRGITWDELGEIKGIKSAAKRRVLLNFLEERGYREKPERDENYERFRSLLEELFQFQSADLDFGIYRIMNEQRDRIEAFLDEELEATVADELSAFQETARGDARDRLEEAEERIGEDFPNWVDEHGNVDEREIPDDAQGIAKERKDEYLDAKRAVESTEIGEDTEAAIYQDLYRFFKRYYDDGDFVPRRRAANQEKYAIPYNGEEVTLHWANTDQYLVKTGERFTDYSFRTNSYDVDFVLHDARVETGNKLGDEKYFVLRDREPIEQDERRLTVHFEYRPLTESDYEEYELSDGSRTKSRDIQAEIEARIRSGVSDQLEAALTRPTESDRSDSTVLRKHLKNYRTRNEEDYFVHRDLEGFLRRELDFYLKNEVFAWRELTDDRGEIPARVRARLDAIENVAGEIIAFVARIEDFQKELYEKKKFVVDTEYCVTLDRVPEALYPEIVANDDQIAAWENLYALDRAEGLQQFIGDERIDESFLRQHQSMMVDTAHFDAEFTFALLEALEPLDESIEGHAIKSENFQALHLLEETFEGDVAASYIDPPYNTGSDTFVYKDNFQSSTWIAMMHDRLDLSRRMLTDDGELFVSIGDDEFANLKKTLDGIFGEENFVADIIWNSTKSVTNPAPISNAHTHSLTYAKDKAAFKDNKEEFRLPAITEGFENPDDDPRGPWKADPFEVGGERPNQRYEITNPETGETFTPKDGNSWKNDYETFRELWENDRIVFGKSGNGRPKRKRFLSEAKQRGTTPTTLWDDVDTTTKATMHLREMFGERELFNNPKPIALVKRFARLGTGPDDYFLDYFAGSGTTAEAIIDLNEEEGSDRRYVVVDMGEYFDRVLKPRIVKSVYADDWDDGEPQSRTDRSHAFRYQSLEQYEDTLDNLAAADEQTDLGEFTPHALEYYLDLAVDGPSLLDVHGLKDPFEYTMEIREGGESKRRSIDVVATFNYLLGLDVRSIRRYENRGREYRAVQGTREGDEVAVVWRPIRDGDDADFFEADREFVRSEILDDEDVVYVNYDSALPDARSIETTFQNRMWD